MGAYGAYSSLDDSEPGHAAHPGVRHGVALRGAVRQGCAALLPEVALGVASGALRTRRVGRITDRPAAEANVLHALRLPVPNHRGCRVLQDSG